MDDINVRAIKTGMLYDADITRAVAQALSSSYDTIPALVCDPVCVSTSGHSLLDPKAIDALITELFPLARLITPNKSEAELLLSHSSFPPFTITTLKDMVTAANQLEKMSSCPVLVKGGHIAVTLREVESLLNDDQVGIIAVRRHGLLEDNMEILQSGGETISPERLVVDVLCEQQNLTLFVRPLINSKNTHGTGCTLSAAITCELARGKECRH